MYVQTLFLCVPVGEHSSKCDIVCIFAARGLTVRQDRQSGTTNGFRHSTKTSAFVSIPHSISEPSSTIVDNRTLSPPSDNDMMSLSGTSFTRDSARKSRLADKWFDAAEKIYDQQREMITFDQQQQTIIIEIAGTIGQPVGITITPNKDESTGKLNSVSVDRIVNGGRVAEDGRISIHDQITEINGRPVYQMSVQRVQSYLLELAQLPTITFTLLANAAAHRRAPPPPHMTNAATSSSVETKSAPKRLVQSALQHANTTKIGRTLTVDLRKGILLL